MMELFRTAGVITLEGSKKVKTQLKDIDKQAENTGGVLKSIGKKAGAAVAMGVATTGVAIGAAAVKGIKQFSGFEKKMNEVFTLMPGASEEMKNKLTEDIRALSTEMGVATKEAVPALYQAISAGIPKDNVINFLKGAQKLAVGGVANLEDSVGVLGTAVNNYKEEGLTAEEASDALFTTVKNGVTTIPELSTALGKVIPNAAELGVGFGEINASMATLTSQMGKGSTEEATTRLRTMLNELGKSGSTASEAFKEIAGTDIRTFIEDGGSLTEAMVLMNENAKETGISIADMFGSQEAGAAAIMLTDNIDKQKKNMKEMNDSAGATEEAYQQMEESFSRNMDKLKTSLNDVFLEIGENLMPIMKDLTDWIIDHMPEIKTTIETSFNIISGVIDGVTTVINTLRNVFSSDTKEISGDMGKMKESISGIIKAIKIIINGFITAITKAWDLFGDDIVENAKMYWDIIKTVIDTALDVIENSLKFWISIFTGDWEGAMEAVKKTWTDLWDGVTKIAGTIWGRIKKPITNAIDNTKDFFSGLKTKVVDTVQEMIEDIQEWFGNTKLGKIVNTVSDITNKVTGFFSGLKETLVGNSIVPDMVNGINTEFGKLSTAELIIKTFKDNVIDWFEDLADSSTGAADSFAGSIVDMADSVTSGQKTLGEALKEMAITFISALEKQVIAAQVAETAKALMQAPLSFGATLAAIPEIIAAAAPALATFEVLKAGIRGLAEGGIIEQAGSVMVGEEGPELLNLPRGAMVQPLPQAAAASNINITITGNYIANDYDINRIGSQLIRKIKSKGGIRQ